MVSAQTKSERLIQLEELLFAHVSGLRRSSIARRLRLHDRTDRFNPHIAAALRNLGQSLRAASGIPASKARTLLTGSCSGGRQ
jgi:hypothetical protein